RSRGRTCDRGGWRRGWGCAPAEWDPSSCAPPAGRRVRRAGDAAGGTPAPDDGSRPLRAPQVRESRTLRLLERVAPNGRHGNLDEGVLLRGVARGAPRPQRIDPLLEELEVLLLDRLFHLGQRGLEEEVLCARAILGPPLEPQLHRPA